MSELAKLTQRYKVSENCIAENGGIILGLTSDNYYEFGDISDPRKVRNYLWTEYGVGEDMDQADRFTEVVFLQDEVTPDQIREAKKQTGAKVDIHASKNSYHVSKKGINKGSAILELATRKHWGNDFLMAVGDADMDIPMFESVDYIFAVGNASEGAKNVAGYVLEGKYEQGIGEIYRLIDGMRP